MPIYPSVCNFTDCWSLEVIFLIHLAIYLLVISVYVFIGINKYNKSTLYTGGQSAKRTQLILRYLTAINQNHIMLTELLRKKSMIQYFTIVYKNLREYFPIDRLGGLYSAINLLLRGGDNVRNITLRVAGGTDLRVQQFKTTKLYISLQYSFTNNSMQSL